MITRLEIGWSSVCISCDNILVLAASVSALDSAVVGVGSTANVIWVLCHLGAQFKFELIIQDQFDISKIKPIIQEYPEDIFTVIGLKYEDMVLEKENEEGFDGPGYVYFYLSNNK